MVKITDIAKALGVSIGTVDRALHNRPDVNPLTRKRVLQAAATMGYKPNLAASVLSSKRRFRISVNLPREIASFYDQVRAGIKEEHSLIAETSLDLEFRDFPSIGVGEEEAFDAAIAANVNGIIATIGHPNHLKSRIRKAKHANIPVISVTTDAPGTGRLAAVCAAANVSGSLAADLIGRLLRTDGSLAIVTGDLQTSDHAEKLQGFQATMRSFFPSLQLLPPIEAHDSSEEAREKFLRLLDTEPNLVGCYISTSNSLPILKALKSRQLLTSTTVVTTDLFPGLVPYLRSGAVAATLFQRPRAQGQLSLRALHTFISKGNSPSDRIELVPHVITRSTLDYFLQRYLSSEI